MSIKRSKQRSHGSGRDAGDSGDYFAKPKNPEKNWEQHMEGKTDTDFLPYAMSNRYVLGAFVAHSKFGRGIVVSVDSTNVQILFQDGTKKLGHGVTA
jgi:hypothetical protein